MQSSHDNDTEILASHYKSLSFKATNLELWDRSVQGKTIGIRIHSMLPQISLTPEVLQTLSESVRQQKIGICKASKYSSTHFLSLFTTECVWPDSNSFPKADYLIYTKPISVSKIVDHMLHDEKMLENFYTSLEKIVARNQRTEILDLCRTMILFSRDNSSALVRRFGLGNRL